MKPSLRDRLFRDARECAYCGVEFVDPRAVAAYWNLVGPQPPFPKGHRWHPDYELEWALVDRHSDRVHSATYPRGAHPSLDHRVPQCRGGPDSAWNLSVVCRECNTAKGEQPLWAFLAGEGRVDSGAKTNAQFLRTLTKALS